MTFVDTNVLVYAGSARAPLHGRARQSLDGSGPQRLCISRQVLREYLAAMTRPQTWGKPLSLDEAVADSVIFAERFEILDDGPLVWEQLVGLGRRCAFGGRQVHDANIVATMLVHGERRLLTFNDADFLRFAPLIELVVP